MCKFSAVHTPVDQVKEDISAGEYHARVGVYGVGVLDDPESSDSLFLGPRGLVVQREMHHHSFLFVRHVLGRHGGPGVPCEAVGVRFTVGTVQHHGPGVGHTAGARERLGLEKKESLLVKR